MAQLSLWQQWRLSWHLRPLLGLAFCVALGTAAGLHFALGSMRVASALPSPTPKLLLAPLGIALGLFALAARDQNLRRLWCYCGLACAMSGYAAWRVLPPPHDISRVVTSTPQDSHLTVRGIVVSMPQRNEFGTQLMLQCGDDSASNTSDIPRGRVWLSMPPMPALRQQLGRDLVIDDALQVSLELQSISLATNHGERDEGWSILLDRSWCRGRVRTPQDVALIKLPVQFTVERYLAHWRKRLLEHYVLAFRQLNFPFPSASAQLLTAMAFGEGGLLEPLPQRVREDFRTAGMSHILVASGTQVSFLCLLVLGACRLLGVRRWPLIFVLVPLLLTYALIAGGQASIWRAAVAGVCVALAILQGRDTDALSLWSLALVILLLIDPTQLFDVGFQLSFAATWGLIVVGTALQTAFERLFGRNSFVTVAAFSLAAQAGVAPLVAYHFGRFSLVGLGANLLGVPLAGVLVGSSLADLLMPLPLLHMLNYYLATSIAHVAHQAAQWPGASLERPPLSLLWTVVLYGMMLMALTVKPHDQFWLPLRHEFEAWRRRHHLRLPTIAIVALSVVLAWLGWRVYEQWSFTPSPSTLRLTMLDVGQGDSLLVRSPAGRNVLIDGGGTARFARENVGSTVIVPYLQAMGVRRLDALVLTHADTDHCNGLLAVVREVPVGMVIDGAQQHEGTASEYWQLRQALSARKIPVVAASSGQRLDLGAGARMEVLAPLAPLFRGEKADNNNAVTLRLDYGKSSMLLTGDIEREAEERLVRRGANLQCTLLKVAHHGSQTSTSELLLRAAQPRAALISCGRYNSFGHPATKVLDRLAKHRVAAFRTDISGALEVTCDTQSCSIQAQR